MTSDRTGTTECFVYVTLPGETSAVTAGRLTVELDRAGTPNGTFVYGRSYLDSREAVEIDPVELRLGRGPFETVRLRGLFGAIRDAGPDYWGRRVIERHSGHGQLGEIDYLLHSPDDRAGALGFGLGKVPPAPSREYNRTIDLARLQELADRIVADEAPAGAEAEQVQEFLLVGTSMGGARPKAVVEDAEGLWVAKFNKADDRWNMARVEHAMLELARACGLNAAHSRVDTVGGRDVLLVKRFDRKKVEGGYERARMASALTLLRADENQRERWSYVFLAEEMRRVVAEPLRDLPELFRRMCFNALISNVDDHPRNHAVIAPGKGWELSPAYDLTPATPISVEARDLAMSCGDMGRRASAANLISQSARFLLKPEQAAAMVDDMRKTVEARWYEVSRSCGVGEGDCGRISTAFAYEGFGRAG